MNELCIHNINMCTGALLGYNLTEATSMTNQFDQYVKMSSLNKLIKYVCECECDVVSG